MEAIVATPSFSRVLCGKGWEPNELWVPHSGRVFVFAARLGVLEEKWKQSWVPHPFPASCLAGKGGTRKHRTLGAHPGRVFVFAARLGVLRKKWKPSWVPHPFPASCAGKGGEPIELWVPHPGRVFVFAARLGVLEGRMETIVAAPSFSRVLCGKGWEPQTSNFGCPTLAASLFLRLGWGSWRKKWKPSWLPHPFPASCAGKGGNRKHRTLGAPS